MIAEMSGRVTGVWLDKGTGALDTVRIENSRGDITIFKPDAWLDEQAFQESVGKAVEVRVVVTVPL